MNLISHHIPSSEGLGVDLFHYLFPITSHHTPTLRGAWEGFIQRGLEAFRKKAGHPYVRGIPLFTSHLPPERGQGVRSYLTSFLTFPLPSLTMTTCFVPPGTVSAVVTIPESV